MLKGRRGVYFPPRSLAEEEHLRRVRRDPREVEVFRSQVTASAIESAIVHLGALREGRKTLILVTESLSPLGWSPYQAPETYQIDLPLTTIARGEYAVAITARSGDSRTEAFVAFRVVR
jgi:hypothetical protein